MLDALVNAALLLLRPWYEGESAIEPERVSDKLHRPPHRERPRFPELGFDRTWDIRDRIDSDCSAWAALGRERKRRIWEGQFTVFSAVARTTVAGRSCLSAATSTCGGRTDGVDALTEAFACHIESRTWQGVKMAGKTAARLALSVVDCQF